MRNTHTHTSFRLWKYFRKKKKKKKWNETKRPTKQQSFSMLIRGERDPATVCDVCTLWQAWIYNRLLPPVRASKRSAIELVLTRSQIKRAENVVFIKIGTTEQRVCWANRTVWMMGPGAVGVGVGVELRQRRWLERSPCNYRWNVNMGRDFLFGGGGLVSNFDPQHICLAIFMLGDDWWPTNQQIN